MNQLTLVYQEPAMPDSNEELIRMLDLGDVYTGSNMGISSSNTGKIVDDNVRNLDDIVRNLDLDCFTGAPSVVSAISNGFDSIQGHQQFMGYQPTETISYVDLTPPEIDNSPYNVSGGSLFVNEAYSSPASPQEVSSFVPTTPTYPQEVRSFVPTARVENQDTRKPAGIKTTTRRRREPKVKLYEREEPLSDPEEEKKRQNAINAKMNRDKQKHKLQELENLANSLTVERDALQATNTKLRNKCDAFETQLKTVCQQFNVPVIILPQ